MIFLSIDWTFNRLIIWALQKLFPYSLWNLNHLHSQTLCLFTTYDATAANWYGVPHLLWLDQWKHYPAARKGEVLSFHFRPKLSQQQKSCALSTSGLSANKNEPQQRNSPTGEHHSEMHTRIHEESENKFVHPHNNKH